MAGRERTLRRRPAGVRSVSRLSVRLLGERRAARSLFATLHAVREPDGRAGQGGVTTTTTSGSCASAWEAPRRRDRRSVAPFAKGGPYSPLLLQTSHLVVNWGMAQRDAQGFRRDRGQSAVESAQPSIELLLPPGPDLAAPNESGLSLRVLPAGCIFARQGSRGVRRGDDRDGAARAAGDREQSSRSVPRMRCSWPIELAQSSTRSASSSAPPSPTSRPPTRPALAALARRAWSLKRTLDTRTETSHAFILPALLQVAGRHARRPRRRLGRARPHGRGRARRDPGRDRRALLRSVRHRRGGPPRHHRGLRRAARPARRRGRRGRLPDADDRGRGRGRRPAADTATLAAELVSWAVGVAFGRFDVRLATGERALPAEPEPFDPLPVCSPGMLTGADGLPLRRAARRLPARLPAGRHPRRRPGPPARPHRRRPRRLRRRLRRLGRRASGRRRRACSTRRATTCAPGCARAFFEHHLKRHSKSRRKAPILWQLATPSASYSRLALRPPPHAATASSASHNDVVAPKLALEERKLSSRSTQECRPEPDRRASGRRSPRQEAVRRRAPRLPRRGPPGRPALEARPRRRHRPRRWPRSGASSRSTRPGRRS